MLKKKWDLRGLFDKVGCAVVLVESSNGSIVAANSEMENLTKFPKEELEKKFLKDFFTKKEARRVYNLLKIEAKHLDCALKESDLLLKSRSGKKVPVAVCVCASEQPSIKIVSILDETSQKEAEWKLAETQSALVESEKFKSLGEMAGGIAHEINNPLAIAQGVAECIRALSDDQKTKDLVGQMIQATKRIADIVKGLKTFSRDNDAAEKALHSVDSLVESTLTFCREKIQNGGVKLDINMPTEECVIDCNSTLISQVFLNLLVNSYDAIESMDSPWIRIDVVNNLNSVDIRFTDSGAGIPEDTQQRMMEPFFTTKTVGKGTGLGLSLSKSIVESQNGIFFYDKKCQNTSFVVTFKRPKEQLKAVPSNTEVLPPPLKQKNTATTANDFVILVVDDEPDLRQILNLRLSSSGYQVLCANNGQSAVEIINKQTIDLVLTDIRMPNGDGFWLLKKLNELEKTIPLFFLTGSVTLSIEDLYEEGAQAVFFKPIDFLALERQIKIMQSSKNYFWTRKQLRIEHQIPIFTKYSNRPVEHPHIINIGAGGMFLAISGDLPKIDEKLIFKIPLTRESGENVEVRGQGVVRWIREKGAQSDIYGAGVEFTKLTEEGKKYLIEYVNSLMTTPAEDSQKITNKKKSA